MVRSVVLSLAASCGEMGAFVKVPKRFLPWNFLVPTEELFSSKGGTIKGKGIRERIAGK